MVSRATSPEAVASLRAASACELSHEEAADLARVIVFEAQSRPYDDAVEIVAERLRAIHHDGATAGIHRGTSAASELFGSIGRMMGAAR